jgi:hypothetical protein
MKKITNIIFFLLLSSLAVGQNTLPMNVDTVFAKKNLKVGRSLFLMDTSYRKSGKVLSVDSLTGRVILVNNSAASSNVDSSKWERVNNKLQPKNTIDSVLLHKKLILDDYKNQTIEVPEYQTKIATSLSYNNIFNEIQATQACDASGFTTLSTINTINGVMYNFTPTTCGLTADVWELSLNFPVNYTSCPGAYVDEIKVRTVGVSNNGGGYGTCLKVDGINTEYNGQPIYSDEVNNNPFDYLFVDTTNRTSLSSIIATFLWGGTADLGLDGMEVILKIGGCENKYIVLNTDSRGIVKLDTLPDFITLDDLPAPENFANTDLTFTGNRTHNGNGNDLEITNLNNSTISANNSIENIGVSKTIQITDNTTGYTLSHTEGAQQVFYNYTNIPNTVSNFSIIPERGNVHYNLESGLSGGTEYETIQTRDTTIELTVKNSDGIYGGLRIEPNSFEIKTKSNQNTPTATPGQVLTLIDQYTGECDWADAGGGNNFANTDTISMTYAQFYNTITNNNLQVGKTYILVDFQTIYDQMDFDAGGSLKPTLVTKTGATEQIWVLALSSNQIASKAYSATYPNDQIQYDWTYNATFVNGSPAKGRISERIDENNNRTDYDHREIKFIRYDDGAGNFTVINDNGNASQEFLTFVQNFTGGTVKDNWLGDFYNYGALFGQEYGNNVFSGNFVISNTSSALFYSNTFSGGNVYSNTFSGKVYSNTFSGNVYSNTFSGGNVYSNTFSGEVYSNTFSGGYVYSNTFSGIVNNNTFSGYVYSNTFSGIVNNNTFSGHVRSNTFSGYVRSNTFSGYVQYNTFTHTNTLQYCTIASRLENKTIDDVTYPILFGNDFKKEIIKASNGNDYIKTFDGTIDQYILIP